MAPCESLESGASNSATAAGKIEARDGCWSLLGAGPGAGAGAGVGAGVSLAPELPEEPDVELPAPELLDPLVPDPAVDPVLPEPELPEPDPVVEPVLPPVGSPVPGAGGVDGTEAVAVLVVLVAGAEPVALPEADGLGADGDAAAWIPAAEGGAEGWLDAGVLAAGLEPPGHGDAENSLISGAEAGAVIPGGGGAAPIRAAWAAGLGAITGAVPPVAELTAEAAAAAEEEAESCCDDWHPDPFFVPGVAGTCVAGTPDTGPAAGADAAAAGAEPCRETPVPLPAPVPSRPEAGLPASTLELACTRASRSGPTDTARVAEIASATPVSAGPSRNAGCHPGQAKRVRRGGRAGRAQ